MTSHLSLRAIADLYNGPTQSSTHVGSEARQSHSAPRTIETSAHRPGALRSVRTLDVTCYMALRPRRTGIAAPRLYSACCLSV